MKISKKLLSAFLALSLSVASFPVLPANATPISAMQFAGVDVSSAIALENSGVVFRDANGNPADLFATLADAGVNIVRVRIWNDPYNAQGVPYGGGICDADIAVQIAQRCRKVGLKLLLDFHYSDFWADPAKQSAPKAWKNMNTAQKADAIYSYTADTIQKVAATGAEIAMVQIGNETTTGMCGIHLDDYNWSNEGWAQLAQLWNAGAKAVRAYDPNVKVVLHFTNPEKSGHYAYIAKNLQQNHVDYDVFASSYYPYWHGTLSNLSSVLNEIANSYGKEVMVAETSWCYSMQDTDCYNNTVPDLSPLGDYVKYPVSVAGQTQYLTDLFRTVANVKNGIGVFYWEPAWLTVGNEYYHNLDIWETYGSGWATKASQEYDPDGKDYGGSSVDNQALFDANGKPLDSLYVFRKITDGNTQEAFGENLLENPSFEADGGWTNAPKGWKLQSATSGHFDVRAEDVRTGSYALHWYSEQALSESTAATAVTAPQDGTYRASLNVQADSTSEIMVTMQTSGGKTETMALSGKGWSEWMNPVLHVEARKGEQITLTVAVKGGAGCYGSVDDCEICREREAAATTTTTSTTATTTTTATTAEILQGDADCDGDVNINDVILLSRYISEDAAAKLTEMGTANSECDGKEGLTAGDVTALILKIAKLEDTEK